jgi:hypothetical protein
MPYTNPSIQKALANTVKLEETLASIDRLLIIMDKALNRIQPPKTGKLRIYWKAWERAGQANSTPYLAKWIHTSNGRWRCEIITQKPKLYIQKRFHFRHHFEQVEMLIDATQKLLVERAAIMEVLRRYQLSLSAHNNVADNLLHSAATSLSNAVTAVNLKGVVYVDLQKMLETDEKSAQEKEGGEESWWED